MDKRLYPITESLFNQRIKPCLLRCKDGRGRRALVSDYQFFCGVLYVLRTGIPWRDLPKVYGSWHTVYTRFKRWSERGWFWQLLRELQAQRSIKIDIAWVDSTTIATHRPGSGCLKKKDLNRLVVDERD